MGLTRRRFLQLSGASAVGAVAFAGCSPQRNELLVESPARLPEDLVTGIDTWYASLCRMCPAGCGIIVRVMEGRAKKIEGNPDYPVNRGKLCARGQAGLQVLYHPDRIRGPLRRSGPRGSGQFQPISWEEALNELGGKLKELRPPGQVPSLALLITAPPRGHLGQLLRRLEQVPGSSIQIAPYEALEEAGTARAALMQVLGYPLGPGFLPHFDIANARFILSFGADFLGTWFSPVQYGVAYGEFRGRPGERGTLVQVEPRMTATGASADQWIPIRPGTEGILALGLAQAMMAQGLVPHSTPYPSLSVLEAYDPQTVARATGVPEKKIVELARRFAIERPSLAIGGGAAAAQANGRFNLTAVLALNRLSASIGHAGGILLNPPSPLPAVPEAGWATGGRRWRLLAEAMRTGRLVSQEGDDMMVVPPQVLLVRGANPVHGLPSSLGLREALDKVPFIASFSSFMDETTAMADLILPEHTYLEDWGSDIPEPAPGFQVVGFQQPVVNPLYDTRSLGDILLALAAELGLGPRLPWKSWKDLLRAGAQDLFQLRRGSIQAASFQEYWMRLLQQGGWWDEGAQEPTLPRIRGGSMADPAPPRFAGSEQEYPFHLLPFPSASLGDGNSAHLPWLQAMPDPITTAVWQTWVEVNVETARRLDLREGDIVRVESPSGSLEAPIYVQPAIHPDVVAIPMGQGHTALGRYAQGRGSNVMDLVAPSFGDDGRLAWAATRVRLTKLGRSLRVSKAEGSVTPVVPPDEEIVGISRT